MRSLASALALLSSLSALGNARTVAISYFDNHSPAPEHQHLAKGLTDMLITDLSGLSSVQIVERARLNAVLEELNLSKSPFIDPASAQKLGKGLSAQLLMTGSLTVLDNKMRLDARLVEVESGKVKAGHAVDGGREDFFSLEKELVELLTQTLELRLDVKEKARLRKSQTENFVAWASYSKGLAAQDQGDAEQARLAFAEAVKADPQYAAARKALERLEEKLSARAVEQASSFAGQVAALDPKAPDFSVALDKLHDRAGGDVPNLERLKYQLELWAIVADKGWKPYAEGRPRAHIDPTRKEYLEVREASSVVGSWGDDAEVAEEVPLVLEYLLSKYGDEPWVAEQLSNDALRARKLLDGQRRPGSTYGEQGQRTSWAHAYLKKVAKLGRARLGKADGAPRATLDRVDQRLAALFAQRDRAYDQAFDRTLKALDPAAPDYSDSWGHLEYAAQEHPVRARRLPRLLDLLEKTFAQKGRPMRGTPKSPVWLEWNTLNQLSNRYVDDPEAVALVPRVGEYCLAKYPDAPYIDSQLRLTAKSVDEHLKDPAPAKRLWEKRPADDPLKAAAPQARALFKKLGASVK